MPELTSHLQLTCLCPLCVSQGFDASFSPAPRNAPVRRVLTRRGKSLCGPSLSPVPGILPEDTCAFKMGNNYSRKKKTGVIYSSRLFYIR